MGGKYRYGWKPDMPDQRDYRLALFETPKPAALLPASVDLTAQMPLIYDQGQLGSCTANSIEGGVEFLLHKLGIGSFPTSRLFVYFQERLDQGDTKDDTGSSIRESCIAVSKYGSPPESQWPYSIANFAIKPPQSVYNDALNTRIKTYLSVAQSSDAMKSCLAAGYPIHVGFTVYTSFESAQVAATGVVPMPKSSEQVLGGHAVMVVGYDDGLGVWLCRNSWGTSWGKAGYFTMPYNYLLSASLSSDFWTLRDFVSPAPTPTPPQPTPTPTPTPTPAPTKVKTAQIDVYSDGSIITTKSGVGYIEQEFHNMSMTNDWGIGIGGH